MAKPKKPLTFPKRFLTDKDPPGLTIRTYSAILGPKSKPRYLNKRSPLMTYSYEIEKAGVFHEENQRIFLAVRDKAKHLLKLAGAIRMEELISGQSGQSSWLLFACTDRLVELGELREIPNGSPPAQHRIFVRGKKENK